jgi:flavin reductase (DIM6/NTAB) family NADH-FMN oxidoreductase RutF
MTAAPEAKPDETPAFDVRDFRNALGCFATGVTVITAANVKGERVGLTANSFSSVSLDPPMVLWSLSMFAPSLRVFQEASHYAVNVLARGHDDLAMKFAKPAEDKFVGVDFREGLGGAPVLHDVVATFECRNAFRYYGGDHVIFLGAVESYAHTPGEPLMFCRGKFGAFQHGEEDGR